MTPRFFLFSFSPLQDIHVNGFRSLEDLRNEWLAIAQNPHQSWLAHVGIDRPRTSLIIPLLDSHVESFLYTESFRLAVPRHLCVGTPVAGLLWSRDAAYHDILVYKAQEIWEHRMNVNVEETLTLVDYGSSRDTEPTVSQTLSNIETVKDPIELLGLFWSLLSEHEITEADFSGPVVRRLTMHGLQKLGDLAGYTMYDLLQIRGFGVAKLADFTTGIRGLIYKLASRSMTDITINPYLSEVQKDRFNLAASDESCNSPTSAKTSTLMDIINQTLTSFGERDQAIVRMRLNDNMTLQAVAEFFHVSRERIRQIEARFAKKLDRQIDRDTLTSRLVTLLTDRKEPLFLDLLETEDPWFADTGSQILFVANIISLLSPIGVTILKIQNRDIITQLVDIDWDTIQSEFLKLLSFHGKGNITHEDVILLAEAHLSAHNCSELIDLFISEVDPRLLFIDGMFYGTDKSVEVVVRSLLHTVTQPLSLDRYAEMVASILGQDVPLHSIHNVLLKNGLLFGRNLFGSYQHLNVSREDQQTVIASAEYIIQFGPEGRQWSCTELLTLLEDGIIDEEVGLDKYILNNILTQSTRLESMGRLIWRKKSHVGSDQRIDFAQACAVILEQAGHPLSEKDIIQQVQQIRGISEYALILPDQHIARIKKGLWGLVERDFCLAPEEIQHVFEQLFDILDTKNQALHVSEIRDALRPRLVLREDVTNEMIVGLAQTDSRFRLRRGKLLCLSTWDTPRRLTVSEAMDTIIDQWSHPMSTQEIVEQISKLIGRPFTNEGFLNTYLNNRGIWFKRELHAWIHGAMSLPLPSDTPNL